MSTTRVMPGLINLEGRTVGTLKVGDMVARHPRPRYEVTCACGSSTTESHDRLMSGAAKCMSSTHNKLTEQRQRLNESESIAAQRRADLEAAQLQASAARMDAETDGWERPTKYAPTPSPRPMTAREVIAARERREAEEAAQREAERPRREAERKAAQEQAEREAELHERGEKQKAYWADWIQADADPKLVVSYAMRAASMPTKDAEAFTAKAAAQFASEPEYAAYRTLENADVILGYLRRNGVLIADVETIRAAFVRLRDLGLLKQKTALQPPAERPEPVNLAVPPERANATTPSGPKVYRGRDQLTGEMRDFSNWEVDRMSSEDYRRTFSIAPTVAELFTAMSDTR
ncbi:hypothetical protein SAMN05421771_1847 [Granulicella pectinivorans]|uniref:Uncharacterized protein n=1 Tax=Granulicella pectinivorans TaxID=474950 RepID=A0A1I6M4Y7_9BACT|nr:hypothetical protein [Granulicella pectinivorans]SFS10785.1 hypothetical protein SAMN05421771_1847 [Granulicella pectinivorans]